MILADQKCIPCQGNVSVLQNETIQRLLAELDREWSVNDRGHLCRSFRFPDFAEALRCANIFGDMAEEEGHHPDLHISYGQLGVEIWTHKIQGLSESDFVLAAKFDREFVTEFGD